MATTAAPPTRPAQTVAPPGTPAGAQLRWPMAELARLPLSDAQVRAHFDAAFRRYVLDALGDAVAAGKVRWDQALTGTEQVKGLPPGERQTRPDGTQVSASTRPAR